VRVRCVGVGTASSCQQKQQTTNSKNQKTKKPKNQKNFASKPLVQKDLGKRPEVHFPRQRKRRDDARDVSVAVSPVLVGQLRETTSQAEGRRDELSTFFLFFWPSRSRVKLKIKLAFSGPEPPKRRAT
jgi:hypothetical protein